MIENYTQVEIEAPVEQVWHIMTDFEAFPDWNPFMKKMMGDLQVGNILKERVFFFGNYYGPVSLKVIHAEEHRVIGLWRSGPSILNLGFFGYHIFEFHRISPEHTRFTHRWLAVGLVPWLTQWFLHRGVRDRHEAMNIALKARSES